ncbi:hypothetical protein Hanom_Chr16g01437001 [Helianthus anomalus]
MNSLSGMKIIKRFPPENVKRFKGADGQAFVPKELPAQFDPIDPPTVLEKVPEHEPKMCIPDHHSRVDHPGASVPTACWAWSPPPLTRGVLAATS